MNEVNDIIQKLITIIVISAFFYWIYKSMGDNKLKNWIEEQIDTLKGGISNGKK